MNDNGRVRRMGREGLRATPPPRIRCDKCGREDVPAVLRLVINHPLAPVHTFCIACDPGGVHG